MTQETKDATSQTDDVFGSTSPKKDTQDTGTKDTSANDIFSSLVGEDKKFKTPEDLAKGKLESDQFIEQLQRETKELREELGRRPTKEELLDTIRASQKDDQGNQTGLDEEAVRTLINKQVTEYDSQKAAAKNIETAANKMIELYGQKAGEITYNKAQELGVSVDYLKDLSARSPQAFYNVMGINASSQKDTSNKNLESNTNTETFKPGGGGHNPPSSPKTWSEFETLRKENPKLYFSPKVQNEIFKMRKEKGEEFLKS